MQEESKRQPIRSCPTGSPLAGFASVWDLDDQRHWLRDEKPWTPALRDTPGHSIEQHVGQRWAKPEPEADDA